ncbi:hypothetical protein RRF57_009741 [Xylaria bambusicola]|uniref:Uncharacterized protein n=1 Tax=Xylaria bambusicola TaxID=326684 RepID=A0AAN7Z955_9PEZI
MAIGLTTIPSAPGGKGNIEGDGDIGVGPAVGARVLTGETGKVAGSTDDVVASASTTHLEDEKSGLGTMGELPVWGTLDFHFSSSGPSDTIID